MATACDFSERVRLCATRLQESGVAALGGLATCGVPDSVRQALAGPLHSSLAHASQSVQSRAVERAREDHSRANWALVDVYSELRERQAARWNE